MKSFRKLLAAILISCGMIGLCARAAENPKVEIKELSEVPATNLKPSPMDNKTNIYRIKTAAAFKRLQGAENFKFDFNANDLVLVGGTMGCAHGKVEYAINDETVTFNVKITERCQHLTRQLCMFPYSAAFAVSKNAKISTCVIVAANIWGRIVPQEERDKKLADPNVTHLNLAGMNITDEDLAKLKGFKNLTHLYLDNNKITDKGLANLSHLTGLYQLFLGNNPGITDEGIQHLRPIMTARIQILGINGTGITETGLKQLQDWSAPQIVPNRNTQINHSIVTPQVME
jgi:Leucine-rich repeat (LRR) protein